MLIREKDIDNARTSARDLQIATSARVHARAFVTSAQRRAARAALSQSRPVSRLMPFVLYYGMMHSCITGRGASQRVQWTGLYGLSIHPTAGSDEEKEEEMEERNAPAVIATAVRNLRRRERSLEGLSRAERLYILFEDCGEKLRCVNLLSAFLCITSRSRGLRIIIVLRTHFSITARACHYSFIYLCGENYL